MAVDFPPFPSPAEPFLWATGIEDTFVPQTRPGHRALDEYQLMGHYEHWREDLALARELGVRAIRWGVPWYRVEPLPGEFDWSFPDQVIPYLVRELGIAPIVDLMHYGCPFWLRREFASELYPEAVAAYAGAFARRYAGLVRWYTPLNEPLVNALFCGRRGVWPPYLRGDGGYIRVMLHLVRGIQRTVAAIKEVDPEAVMVHVEAAGLARAARKDLQALAVEEHRRGFLGYDLIAGRVGSDHPLYTWLLRNGAGPDELAAIAAAGVPIEVLGLNFYPQWSTQQIRVDRRGRISYRAVEEDGPGFASLIREYHQRYGAPVMITETSARGSVEVRSRWLEASVAAVRRLRGEGVPVVGYTWFPLFTMIDWRYRFGRRPLERYRLDLGLYTLADGDRARAGRRWDPTPLVDRFRELAKDPLVVDPEPAVDPTPAIDPTPAPGAVDQIPAPGAPGSRSPGAGASVSAAPRAPLEDRPAPTYTNPVYPHSFPDPFVLKHRGEYWAYSTGFWFDGRCFGVLHSRDLVHWRPLQGAMEPLPGNLPCYWAPEVTYRDGRFFLYYSAGDEETMAMRVAVAASPAGPFLDSGRRLTREPFAIDGHLFADRDGTRWLFYATDFLDRSHVGTGTVVDRMLDPWTLQGDPRPVTLPRHDWQVYDPARREKGGVRWHTVEGPFVLERKGLYYQMFSGGNWQHPSYGVAYATSDRIDAAGEWEQAADGHRVQPILRTLPGEVVGPGHNSVVRGPDNRQLYCVYHRWSGDRSGRVLSLDPLDWAGDRMLVLGPSVGPRPAPLAATWSDFFDAGPRAGLGPGWELAGGEWSCGGGEAVQASTTPAAALAPALPPCFAAEVSLRALARPGAPGAFGAGLDGGDGELLRAWLSPAGEHLRIVLEGAEGRREEPVYLPVGFDTAAYHLLRLEADGRRASVALDGREVWRGRLAAAATRAALATDGLAAAFSGFAVTVSWEDLFPDEGEDPAALGWEIAEGGSGWEVAGRELRHRGGSGSAAKGPLLPAYELVVAGRLGDALAAGALWGIRPALRPDDPGPLLGVARHGAGWAVFARQGGEEWVFPLPGGFDAGVHQQLRVRKEGSRLTFSWEGLVLGALDLPGAEATRIGLRAEGEAAFDMVRLTAIGSP